MPTVNTVTRSLSRSQSALRIERREKGSAVVTGYAAVFYRENDPTTEYRLWSDLVERIMPGAFDKAIIEDDVRALANHDPNLLLGRTKSGTLRLSIDATGLRYEIDTPDTQTARDLVASIERGDMDGSSFAFSVNGKRGKVTYSRAVIDGNAVDIREVREVELFDVGPVTYPAYEGTSTGIRSAGCAQTLAERDAIRSRERNTTDAAVIATAVNARYASLA